MVFEVSRDRVAPPKVQAVERDGVRYAQASDGRDFGHAADGVLMATEVTTGRQLWTLVVYRTPRQPGLEEDVQWRFFSSMAFDPDGRLRIVAEGGAVFLVDVKTREVTSPSSPSSPSPSRPPPPVVPPVLHQGVRYEQDRVDERDQPGGYLAAFDAATGARLWRQQVYALRQEPGAPTGGAIFFRAMSVVADGSAIAIEDEVGGRYRVDLRTRAVTRVGGPPIEAPPSPPVPPKPAD
jgi:hypothetical protein